MFKGISWSSYLLFMLVAVILYYVVVALLYYRPEIMALIQSRGKGAVGAGAKPVQPVLVVTGSAFSEQEEEEGVVPVPEPHLPAAAVAAAATLAAAGNEAAESQEPTMDDGTGKVLNSDDAAVADEYENPAQDAEETELAEAKRLLAQAKEDSSNPDSAAAEGDNNEELNQIEGKRVVNTHNVARFTKQESNESLFSTMGSFVEPVDLNEEAEPLQMIQIEDELEVSDTLIDAGDLSNLLDGLAAGEIGGEELAEVAPAFSDTELSTRFAANKKRRNQEVESLFDDE